MPECSRRRYVPSAQGSLAASVSFRCASESGYPLAVADCIKDFEIVVTYVGANPEGAHFFASVVGVVPRNFATGI